MPMSDIVDQIIKIRKERGITQADLSKMTGILQPAIARVESKRQSPTIEFINRILTVMDLELVAVDAYSAPQEISEILKDLPHKRVMSGRSEDKVFVFNDQYVLKISDNIEELRKEKEKTDWLSDKLLGSKTVKYIEENEKAYYLRTFIKGTSLIQDKFLKNPLLLIVILKDVIERLRKLDQYDCPFVSDTSGNDFVHGDLCLPNIIVDENNQFAGFIDLSNAGKGDKDYDYSWLTWSFEYNTKTKKYTKTLLNELGIEIDTTKYLSYVIPNIIKNK